MKNKITIVGIAALLLIFSSAVFAANPDFSGVWSLDKSKSEGLPAGMNQEMTVKQTGDKISVETKLMMEQGDQTVPDSYTLDGKETDFTPKGQNGSSGKGKRTAKWTSDGFEVTESATFETPDGDANVKTTRKWTLSADGKILKIDISQQLPNGETREVKRTFNKK